MSRRSREIPGVKALIGVLLLATSGGSLGCWEQVSREWFPLMKRQLALQAFELNTYVGDGSGLTPPDGTVQVGNPTPDVANMAILDQEQLANPVSASLQSLKNGEVLFGRYCTTCHGPNGHGDGPVAGPPFGTGPFGLVLPIGGPASVVRAFSDGHLYTTITLGRGRMPNYRRVPAEGRWDIVNYIRDINGQGGRQ
ncbi:MAG: cytochrome c [Deltaproteobacteria bacterium]|nr:cytochrome c [Deltaproteobacteria bacterium]MBW2383092.1 cytochrome c [Deltaproteobacteria bacterium]MBW2696068.1 cytochrome c [Deltaproteobacteria bacterium]